MGAKNKFKYELQGFFATERIYLSLNTKNVLSVEGLIPRHKRLMNNKKRNYQKH